MDEEPTVAETKLAAASIGVSLTSFTSLVTRSQSSESLECNGRRSLLFSKVLDTFEEIDDGTSIDSNTYSRDYWTKTAKWTVDTAEVLLTTVQDLLAEPMLNFVKNYVAITVSGNNYFWLHKRSSNKSLLGFRMSPALQDEAAALLDGKNISYARKPRKFMLTVGEGMVEGNQDVMRSIASLSKEPGRPMARAGAQQQGAGGTRSGSSRALCMPRRQLN